MCHLTEGDPRDKRDPAYTFYLIPIDDPDCNIVWVQLDWKDEGWQSLMPWGCKELPKPSSFYRELFEKARAKFFKPAFDA